MPGGSFTCRLVQMFRPSPRSAVVSTHATCPDGGARSTPGANTTIDRGSGRNRSCAVLLIKGVIGSGNGFGIGFRVVRGHRVDSG